MLQNIQNELPGLMLVAMVLLGTGFLFIALGKSPEERKKTKG